MGRKKKPKPLKVRTRMDPEQVRRIKILSAHLSLALLLVGGLGAGYYYADRYVERQTHSTQQLIIVLKNRPSWMNDFLVEQIAAMARPVGAHSTFDRQLLVDTTRALEANPWVRKVHQVRRAYTHRPGDTLEIDCEFRAPVALARWNNFYWLVDENGVRLSDRFTEQDVPNIQFGPERHTTLRVIQGLSRPVPHLAGEKWPGDDLLAGLKMVNYLFDRPYTEDILRVSVANFGGRVDAKDPQIVLETRYNTQIWWGRPPSEDDVDSFIEVSAARKLKYLEELVSQYGRVDGKQQWVDIRFDTLRCPPPPQPATAPPDRRTHR